MIPVPNPYGSNGLIETAVKKKMIGVKIRKVTPDQIRFFLFVFDILNAMKFETPNSSKIMNKNKASITLPLSIHSLCLMMNLQFNWKILMIQF
jgi:hypothetical protein